MTSLIWKRRGGTCKQSGVTLVGLIMLLAAACRRDGGAMAGSPDAQGIDADASGGATGGEDGAGADGQAGAGLAGQGGGAGTDAGAPVDAAAAVTLKSAAAATGRWFGTALDVAYLSQADYAATAAAEFNFATPENEMKWDTTEPAQNTFSFAAGDAIVAFAQKNGLQVKGHTLVWHSQLPAWVSNITDAGALHDAMINHIFQEVLHFRGQVVAWDVVNEAVADSGQALRSTIFSQLLGAGYLDDAFNAAHAADPDARLYYNEYGAEGSGAKSNFVYTMVQGMLSRGVPINGVGLQMHTGSADATPSAAELASNMQRLAALGLDVLISEMDVSLCTGDLDAQALRYHAIVADCVAQPACKAVTVWGIPDKYSWLNGQSCASPRPLLFDDNYLAKPAHLAVVNALGGR